MRLLIESVDYWNDHISIAAKSRELGVLMSFSVEPHNYRTVPGQNIYYSPEEGVVQINGYDPKFGLRSIPASVRI